MKYYAGLDVSLKETFLSVIDEKGKIVFEDKVVTDVQALSTALRGVQVPYEAIGISRVPLSIFLCKGLKKEGFPVLCIDARHTAAALSARVNKNDRNDARGIARILYTGWMKEVEIKTADAVEKKMLLGSRSQLVLCRQKMMGTIRGLLKMYGVVLGTQSDFYNKVEQALQGMSALEQLGIRSLCQGLKGIDDSLAHLNQALEKWADKDQDCQILMSIPGIGKITSLNYLAAIDRVERFEQSSTVGAYLGITPKQYASGEVDRHGRISKMGPKACRTALYEAAQVLLCRTTKTSCCLKKWGLKLMRKKGRKKAIVAVARKLSVIMHRMLINRTMFQEA